MHCKLRQHHRPHLRILMTLSDMELTSVLVSVNGQQTYVSGYNDRLTRFKYQDGGFRRVSLSLPEVLPFEVLLRVPTPF